MKKAHSGSMVKATEALIKSSIRFLLKKKKEDKATLLRLFPEYTDYILSYNQDEEQAANEVSQSQKEEQTDN